MLLPGLAQFEMGTPKRGGKCDINDGEQNIDQRGQDQEILQVSIVAGAWVVEKGPKVAPVEEEDGRIEGRSGLAAEALDAADLLRGPETGECKGNAANGCPYADPQPPAGRAHRRFMKGKP